MNNNSELFECISMCARTRLRPQRSRSKMSWSSSVSFCRRRRRCGWRPCSRSTRRRKSWWRRSPRASPEISSPSPMLSLPWRMRSHLVMLSFFRWVDAASCFLNYFLYTNVYNAFCFDSRIISTPRKGKASSAVQNVLSNSAHYIPVCFIVSEHRSRRRIQKNCQVLFWMWPSTSVPSSTMCGRKWWSWSTTVSSQLSVCDLFTLVKTCVWSRCWSCFSFSGN